MCVCVFMCMSNTTREGVFLLPGVINTGLIERHFSQLRWLSVACLISTFSISLAICPPVLQANTTEAEKSARERGRENEGKGGITT